MPPVQLDRDAAAKLHVGEDLAPRARAVLRHDCIGQGELDARFMEPVGELIVVRSRQIFGESADVLEREVVPAYYERDDRGLPPRWLALMRASIERLGSEFNTNRMVREYVDTMYLPAHRARSALTVAGV